MKASEIMTRDVVSVGPDTPAHEIADVLLRNGISAVPVTDSDGTPLGIVSEGDLVDRSEKDREARRDWWLALLSGGDGPRAEDMARLQASRHTARDLMSAPVITVGEDTDAAEIARLLRAYRIKRVPVLKGGRAVGIVSRADLLRALAASAPPPKPRPANRLFAWIDEEFNRAALESAAAPAPAHPAAEPKATAADFRQLEAEFRSDEARRRERLRRKVVERRQARVQSLIGTHISDDDWRAMIREAQKAAARGDKSHLLLRFPSQLCADGGRRINIRDPEWPQSLRGEAAEVYLRWKRNLKPRGFHLQARVLDFPGGMPGDVGLFLVWGE